MSLKAQIRADKRGNVVIQKALDAGTAIQTGTNAAAVRWVERMLTLNGFNPGKVDNQFSGGTATALKAFQKAWGLPETGALDKATFAKLKATQTRVRSSQQNNKGKIDNFGVGQKHGVVKEMEGRLARLGYDVGKRDGVFDQTLRDAVLEFRKDQSNLKDGRGWLSGDARDVVRKEDRALNHGVYRTRVLKEHKPRKRLDALTAKKAGEASVNGVGFGEGSKGRHVANVQAHLKHAGFDPKNTKGVFDERTEAALKAFQRKSGLEPTGKVTPKTWAALQKTYIYANGSFSPAQRRGERSSAVRATEKVLRKLGYKSVKADGIFDAKTERAVKMFEKKNKLGRDGIVTAGNYKKMKKVLAARQSAVHAGKGWAGSEGVADTAKRIAKQMGIPVTSTKRSAAGSIGSSTTSDHHVSQKNAYAVDLGVAGSRGSELARRIARAYGIKGNVIGTFAGHNIRVDGKVYRIQILWQVPNHFDHVHVGIRRVG